MITMIPYLNSHNIIDKELHATVKSFEVSFRDSLNKERKKNSLFGVPWSNAPSPMNMTCTISTITSMCTTAYTPTY